LIESSWSWRGMWRMMKLWFSVPETRSQVSFSCRLSSNFFIASEWICYGNFIDCSSPRP
jgi:hypothetical protein